MKIIFAVFYPTFSPVFFSAFVSWISGEIYAVKRVNYRDAASKLSEVKRMKLFSKISAVFLSLVLCVGMFSACGTTETGDDKYKVIFNYNNPSLMGAAAYNVVEVTKDETVTKPDNPTREDYVFDFWATNIAGTKEYDFNAAVVSDIKLFAKWNQAVATVTFNTNGGSEIAEQKIDLKDASARAARPATNPTKEDCEFINWYADAGCTVLFDFENTVIESDTVIYAGWKQTKATISFVMNGAEPQIPSYKIDLTDGSGKITAPTAPTKTDYEFLGWYEDALCTTKYDFDKVVTQDVTLYAGWKIIRATVVFATNGGSEVPAQKITVSDTAKVQKPSDPTKTGHTFTGWYLDDTCVTEYNFNAVVTDNLTLYAGWEKEEYTVTFNLGYSGAQSVAATVKYGEPAVYPEGEPTRSGYIFDDWYLGASSSADMYDGSGITGNTTLYAKWISSSTKVYQLTLDNNYSGGGSNTINAYQGKRVSSILPKNPTRRGYYFAGWYMDAACENALSSSLKVSSNLTLYAKWMQTYTFEAEYTNLNGVPWNGTSDNGSSFSGIGSSIQSVENVTNREELADNVSNGYFVQKQFNSASVITFHITSSVAVDNAVLTLRLSPDMFDLYFAGTENYTIAVNGGESDGGQTFYLDHNLTGAYTENDLEHNGLYYKRAFENYEISAYVRLNAGDNVITLTPTNDNAHTGTIWAEAPMVDCLYLSADSVLAWKQGFCFPGQVGQTMSDVKYDVTVD